MADPIVGKFSVGDGATFTPSVDANGVMSWSNNKNLPNPASYDIGAKVDSAAQAEVAAQLPGAIAAVVPANTGSATNPVYVDGNGVVQAGSVNLVPTATTETNSISTSYSVSVPSSKVFANFNKFYGKTYAWNQQDNPFTVWTTSTMITPPKGATVVSGHKYFYKASFSSGATRLLALFTRVSGTNAEVARLDASTPAKVFTSSYTATSNGATALVDIPINGNLWEYANEDAGTITEAQLVDLTLLFGSGNEPSTVADFYTACHAIGLYPDTTIYPFFNGLLSATVSNVKSKDSSNNVIANMPIPSAIQSLPCYGASAGSVKNYIDFENKKYVQNVGSVSLGNFTTDVSNIDDNVFYAWFNTGVNIDSGESGSVGISNRLYIDIDSFNNVVPFSACWDISTVGRIYTVMPYSIKSGLTKNSSAADKKSASAEWARDNNVIVYYPLATPIEHDISDILGASGIACEENGTLIFENSNGSDYQLPVQYDLDFVDGTDGLLTAQDKEKLEVAYEATEQDLSAVLVNPLNFIDDGDFKLGTVVSDRLKNVYGGYKKVGRVVYVYFAFGLKQNLNEGSSYGLMNGFPPPDVPINFIAPLSVSPRRDVYKMIATAGVFKTNATNGQLSISLTSNFTASSDTYTEPAVFIMGWYLAAE